MKNKGFSLVELIVVIAIMAILVGVAVPVYSSYIEKTQKAADQQLVDEIKHAMEIAYVADQFTGSATVVLTTNGASVSGDSSATNDWIADVINNAFGDGTIKLAVQGSGRIRSTRENQSPHYTTRWSDLPKVSVK